MRWGKKTKLSLISIVTNLFFSLVVVLFEAHRQVRIEKDLIGISFERSVKLNDGKRSGK